MSKSAGSASSAYAQLSTGLKIQWVNSSIRSNSLGSITWPVTFSNNNYVCVVMFVASDGSFGVIPWGTYVQKTTAKVTVVKAWDDSTTTVKFLGVGY